MRTALLIISLSILGVIPIFMPAAQAQIGFDVNATQPCFLNYTAGADMWLNCGVEDDYLVFALLPWQWITGGYLSTIIVSIIVMISYIKYHKAVYPLLIGTAYLPFVFTLFPESWLNHVIILAGLEFCILIWYIFIRQTKEY